MTAVEVGSRDPVAVARQAILALIDREHAVVQPEIEVRLCEQPQPGLLARLDPMDVRIARDDLEAAGHIRRLRSRSPHGHREIPVFTSTDTPSPEQQAVAEHKRDLLARYLSWGDGRDNPLRSAAEQVVRASFQVAARSGYRIGQAPPSDVAIFVPHDDAGQPGQPILMPIEVRNTREWLMPHSRGLYQLLIKATRIQVTEREVPMVPMFVCRRAHPRLVAMGRDLGFLVIESRREFILPSVAETAVAEVRAALGLTDLTRADSADRLLVSRLEQIVPSLAMPLVTRWQRTAMTTIPLRFAALLDESALSGRRRILREIRDVADDAGLVAPQSTW
jgi:hypothetical protein